MYIYKGMVACEENFLSPALEKKYVTSDVLGRGSYGEVRLVYEKVCMLWLTSLLTLLLNIMLILVKVVEKRHNNWTINKTS